MPKVTVNPLAGDDDSKHEAHSKKKLRAQMLQKRAERKKERIKTGLEKKQQAKELLQMSKEGVQDDHQVVKRGITQKIAKNRGLTKHTKKEYRNPRVKLRLKYQKAASKHRRLVRVREGPAPTVEAYDGESSGINTRVVRSISLSHR
jgi:U3 small nucleolar RNA-associated protein 3